MGKLVILVKPVIKPSLGPGPKFAIRYIPLPSPTSKTEITAKKYLENKLDGGSNILRVTSIIAAMIIIFITVPMPGVCFKNIHKNKTLTLIKKVAAPIEILVIFEIPSARTDHGEFPVVDSTNKPSPKPKILSPKQRKKNVEILGLKFNGFSELQFLFGIFVIFKNMFYQW